MTQRAIALLLAEIVLSVVSTLAAGAAPQRTFVATTGNDANPCTLTAPCRGFQTAINTVAAGGEVVAIDTGGYGAMEIHKSVSVIVPPGVHAGLSPSTGIPLPGYPGQSGVVLIDIQITDVVVLRGLNINHQGTVTGGIEWISAQGGSVYIEDCVVNGFPKEGVYVQAPAARLFVKNSVFRNNGTSVYVAVVGDGSLQGTPGTGGVVIDGTHIENSGIGVLVLTDTHAVVNHSHVTANNIGFYVQALSLTSRINLDNCEAANNTRLATLETGPNSAAYLVVSASNLMHNGGVNKIGAGSSYVLSYGLNARPLFFNFDTLIPPE